MKKLLVMILAALTNFYFPLQAFAQEPVATQVSGHIQASLIDSQVIKLNVGDEKKIEWRFVSSYKDGLLKINLIAEDGLEITSALKQFTFDINANSEYNVSADIKALLNGRRYLNFYVHYESKDKALDGTTSAIFQIGELSPVREKQVESTGVTLLKAVEDVHQSQ